MQKSEFNFELPDALIAQHPLENRSDSRLLHLDKNTGEVCDRQFKDLLSQLQPNDLLVFNNTKVIPARLKGQKATGGQVEVFIERVLDEKYAKTMLKANKSVKLGTAIYFDGVAKLRVMARNGMFFLCETIDSPLSELMQAHGHMPLPPYITRKADEDDDSRYQTVYAEQAGAVAAPTAGLHFDDELLSQIADKGVRFAHVTLHVGAGTFQPVKSDNIHDHQMHKEWLEVTPEVCDIVKDTQAKGGRVIAVGTTAVRCLETASQSGNIQPFQGDTQIFIFPGYEFKAIDGLITNFHLPESTLVMLVSALAGKDNILNAYQHAIEKEYRFFSYGDAMLII
ncbi:tRNA preQ1(34) S-adenosylmethionine ribosyltransferase-isomerase QueA [Marinicella rhabdoformis]|uniref:tRNA preQ1(34) S-adenosylmethionine ribosyltransferase-isomerase QueA n=1 Tax=Marinicella rhabdoformis TaxID=2580566 RepID=UPI0012AED7F0|nr:tRNA preQ1(34) S-adenosylmethionine ribosyltransferase-isomerase QueA [Marinicella rhabdoformis]